ERRVTERHRILVVEPEAHADLGLVEQPIVVDKFWNLHFRSHARDLGYLTHTAPIVNHGLVYYFEVADSAFLEFASSHLGLVFTLLDVPLGFLDIGAQYPLRVAHGIRGRCTQGLELDLRFPEIMLDRLRR